MGVVTSLHKSKDQIRSAGEEGRGKWGKARTAPGWRINISKAWCEQNFDENVKNLKSIILTKKFADKNAGSSDNCIIGWRNIIYRQQKAV